MRSPKNAGVCCAMKRFRIAVCAGALCAAIVLAAAEDKVKIQTDSKSSSARDSAASPTTHKANEMIGSSVQTKAGERLGTVRDFAFELPSGDLRYVIVASGGILGLGAEYHAVPPKAFSHETQNPKVLSLDTTKEKWDAAPKFKKDQLPNLNAHREQLDKYFEPSNDAKAQVKIGEAKAEVKVKTPDILAEAKRDSAKGEALHLATDVIGNSVVTKANEDVGKVSDLLVDMRAPSIAFAIVATGTLLKPADTRYAIATKNLSFGAEKGKLVLNADRTMLENAERFDPNEWRASRTSAGYFKYEDTDAKVEIATDETKRSDADVTASSAGTTALSLVKEGNRYVGEQARDKVVQVRSERSVNGVKPSVWYVVFYDPTAALKATEVKFINGKMTDVKRPLRLLEATSAQSEPLDRNKIKLDSDEALQAALKEPALQNVKPTSSEMRLERGEAGAPTWKVQLWASKADDSSSDVNLGTVTLSAEDGKVVKSDLKKHKAD
jgi:sporulation protein YlmC with PRC-barrel domain